MSVTLQCSAGALAVLGDSYLRLGLRGAWTSTVVCASKVAPATGEAVQLIVTGEGNDVAPAPSKTFSGTVLRQHLIPGTEEVHASIVAGAGKLSTFLNPADLVPGSTAVPLERVVTDIMKACGETLAAGVATALNAYNVQRWHRMGGTTARDALDQLVGDMTNVTGLQFGWRSFFDGTIWVGVETWPAGGAAEFVADNGDDGTLVYGPNGAPLFPGTVIDGQQAVEILYTLAPPKLRAEVRHPVPGDPVYVANGLELYRQLYAGNVEVQNADGTLDVVCDDARVGQLRSVPIRLGIPGAKVSGIPRLTRIRVGFENGSPRAPFASLIDLDPTATQAIALVGDGVSAGTLTVAGAGVTLQWTPPGGSPGAASTSVSLTGLTVSGPGSTRVKLK